MGEIMLSETLNEAKSALGGKSASGRKKVYCSIAVLVVLGLSRTEGWAHWDIRVLDSTGNVGMYTSVTWNPYYPTRIVYYDATNGALKCITDWGAPQIIDTGNVGLYNSISDRGLDISYYDSTNGDLKHAHWDGSKWNIETVDTAGDVGLYTSIDIGDSNRLEISYYDRTNRCLKYAHWGGGEWNIEKVDTVGEVGMYSQCSVGGIFYYDATNGNVKFAMKDDFGKWGYEIIDSVGDVGRYLSFERTERQDICYYDATNKHLKDDVWHNIPQVVDTSQGVGQYNSVMFSTYGIVVSYYDSINKDLKCAYPDSDEVHIDIEKVDTVGDVGKYTSMGDVHGYTGNYPDTFFIVYYDATNGHLKCATRKFYYGIEEAKKETYFNINSFPNPFTERTFFEFTIPYNVKTSLEVYDVTGKLVKTIVNENLNSGFHKIEWDGKNNQGNRIKSGIYFYKLEANGVPVKVKKIVCL